MHRLRVVTGRVTRVHTARLRRSSPRPASRLVCAHTLAAEHTAPLVALARGALADDTIAAVLDIVSDRPGIARRARMRKVAARDEARRGTERRERDGRAPGIEIGSLQASDKLTHIPVRFQGACARNPAHLIWREPPDASLRGAGVQNDSRSVRRRAR